MVNKEMTLYTLLFVVLGIIEQLANGILKTTFSIMDLLAIYGIIATYYGLNYRTASKYNSASGMEPINTNGGKYYDVR